MRPTQIRDFRMKKVFVILVAVMAVTTGISAQSTDTQQIKMSDLKVPASNLTTELAGKLPGIISYQTVDKPQTDCAEFFFRGVQSFSNINPLILIDGLEVSLDDLARLQINDIASFSVFKDATATAIYGARGSNGVISITTKTGSKDLVETETKTAIVETETSLSADLVTTQIEHEDEDTSEIKTEIVDKGTNDTEDFFPDLKIYPNPFTGTLRLAGAEGSTLQVISTDGVVVHTQKINSPDETIRLEHLRIGAYYFCVNNGKQTKTLKGLKRD